MYENYFALTRNPFTMTPDPSIMYMTPGHREALAGLAYAIMERKGFVSLTGEAGTGKTTLLARTLKFLPTTRVASSVILNPSLTESEFIELMMLDFGFATVPPSKAQRLIRFQEFLLQAKAAGKIVALVVDEAHKLSTGVLEEIRLLSNMELPGEKLLQVVLAGQPELNEVLARTELRQLNQRIAVRLAIQFLTPNDIGQYISLRWSKASSTPPPFTDDAYLDIGRWSRGIPRLVNSICDTALMLAFAETAKVVESRHIKEACLDLCMIKNEVPARVPQNGSAAIPARAKQPLVSAPISAPLGPIRVLDSYSKPKRSFWPPWTIRRRQAQSGNT